MCGINGVFHYSGGQPDVALVRRQADAQRHRGPDDSDVWAEGPAALAQRRLAIVDLSQAGHQPMPNEDRTVWATYNGEFYNWPEIKPGLVARGHVLRGNSDTEMLLHLWEEKGAELVHDLHGMFAFALFDTRARKLLLARDRVGKKPLFYHDDGRRIVFASELKSLMLDPSVPREADPDSIADFLTFQYVPGPQTIFRGVRKLPAGHRLLCDERGARVERYWSLPVGRSGALDPGAAVEQLRAKLTEAVRMRLMSDVPLGAFLSGGLDSSTVVALMCQVSPERVKTFSIGFDEARASELEHARAVARHLGTDHHEFIVRPRAVELLPRLVWAMDEPFADVSMIPTYHVAEMARGHVTVALSGDGGDEAFAGYDTYPWALRYARWDGPTAPLKGLLRWAGAVLPCGHPLGRKLHRMGLDAGLRHLEVMAHFDPRELRGVLSSSLRATAGWHDPLAAAHAAWAAAAARVGPVPALLHLDATTYMIDDVLAKVDRTSMQHSLEVRAPLLDHKVLELVAGLPFEYKLRGGVSKWALREVARPLLPPSILQRGKQGFGVPLDSWFAADFGRLAREVLLDRRARERGWLEPSAVERLIGRAASDRERAPRHLFTLLCLELWAQSWLDRPREALAGPVNGPAALHPAVAGSVGS